MSLPIKRTKTHHSQWSRFLDFAEKHPEVLTKKMEGLFGREKYDKLWTETELTNSLNSIGYIKKSREKWQKAVSDWKGKVRAKAATIKLEQNKTGGGGPGPQLTEIEKRLIGVMGWTSIRGDGILDLGCSSTNFVAIPDTSDHNIETEHNYQFQFVPPTKSNVTLLPPPLIPFLSETNYVTASVSSEIWDTPTSKQVPVEEICRKRKHLMRKPTSSLRHGTNSNLENMHSETMGVLKENNGNIKKLAETEEKIFDIHSRILDLLSTR